MGDASQEPLSPHNLSLKSVTDMADTLKRSSKKRAQWALLPL